MVLVGALRRPPPSPFNTPNTMLWLGDGHTHQHQWCPCAGWASPDPNRLSSPRCMNPFFRGTRLVMSERGDGTQEVAWRVA